MADVIIENGQEVVKLRNHIKLFASSFVEKRGNAALDNTGHAPLRSGLRPGKGGTLCKKFLREK
ncbi:hypothetical protein [Evtepia sp.]|uniref:hypothetical protein n=1 Tax=Evtepia sp. TaxID=2773933 RepID=UPI003F15ECE4